MPIECVIFDIDNTLYSYDEAHAAAFPRLAALARERLGLDEAAFRARYEGTNRTLTARMGKVAAIHNRLIRCQNLLEGLGADLSLALELNECYWGALLDAAVPSPGAAETLRALRARRVRVGIGSDMTARVQLLKLRRLGLLPYVDFIVTSEEAGVEKPEPGLFRLCVQKAGVPAQRCLFVGDHLEKDVRGSARCGLRSLWYHSADAPEAAGVTRIRALPEVLEHLED